MRLNNAPERRLAIGRPSPSRMAMPIEQLNAVMSERRAALQRELDRALAGWPAEFTLEIGCGHGHFLAAYAAAHPDEHCLGIDIVLDRLDRAERKVKRAGSANVGFVRAEAGLFLATLPGSFRFHHVFILFPDPWPKRRHHKNRLINPEFLTMLIPRMAPGARLYFRTDYSPYFNWSCDLLQEHPAWRLCDEPWPFEHPTVFQNRAAGHWSLVAALRQAAP